MQRETREGVIVRDLEHWRDFIQVLVRELANCPAYLYRGQANADWKVNSTLDRLEHKFPTKRNFVGGSPEHFKIPPVGRDEHLKAFQEAALGKGGLSNFKLNDDEWWILAQQHGLATPMLDFTHSPFIALFFAFEEEWCILDGKYGEPEYRAVFAVSSSLVKGFLAPRRNDVGYRLTNQAGVFLKMPEDSDLESHVRQEFSGDTLGHDNFHPRSVLQKFRIRNRDRCECLKLLNKMNINRMSLFPDLDGAAKYVNQLWELDFDSSRGRLSAP